MYKKQKMLDYLNTFISLFGLSNQIISGIKNDKNLDTLINEIQSVGIAIDKLSDNIYYTSSINSINFIETEGSKILDKNIIHNLLDPISAITKNKILASSFWRTPTPTMELINTNPSLILHSITPISKVKPNDNPDMIPVIFTRNNKKFVGWQLRGILPLIFKLEFNDIGELTMKLKNKEEINLKKVFNEFFINDKGNWISKLNNKDLKGHFSNDGLIVFNNFPCTWLEKKLSLEPETAISEVNNLINLNPHLNFSIEMSIKILSGNKNNCSGILIENHPNKESYYFGINHKNEAHVYLKEKPLPILGNITEILLKKNFNLGKKQYIKISVTKNWASTKFFVNDSFIYETGISYSNKSLNVGVFFGKNTKILLQYITALN